MPHSSGTSHEQVVPLPPKHAERYVVVHYAGYRDIYGSEVLAQGESDESLEAAIQAMHDAELDQVEKLVTAAEALRAASERFSGSA